MTILSDLKAARDSLADLQARHANPGNEPKPRHAAIHAAIELAVKLERQAKTLPTGASDG